MHVSFGFIVHNKPQVTLHYPLQMCGRLLGTFALRCESLASPHTIKGFLRSFLPWYHSLTLQHALNPLNHSPFTAQTKHLLIWHCLHWWSQMLQSNQTRHSMHSRHSISRKGCVFIIHTKYFCLKRGYGKGMHHTCCKDVSGINYSLVKKRPLMKEHPPPTLAQFPV